MNLENLEDLDILKKFKGNRNLIEVIQALNINIKKTKYGVINILLKKDSVLENKGEDVGKNDGKEIGEDVGKNDGKEIGEDVGKDVLNRVLLKLVDVNKAISKEIILKLIKGVNSKLNLFNIIDSIDTNKLILLLDSPEIEPFIKYINSNDYLSIITTIHQTPHDEIGMLLEDIKIQGEYSSKILRTLIFIKQYFKKNLSKKN